MKQEVEPDSRALDGSPPPSSWVTAKSVGAIALVSLVDWWTGPDVALSIFYAFPVAFATWRGGRDLGLAMAALAMGAWAVLEVLDTPRPHHAYHFWNAVVRGGTFAVIAYLVARVRDLLAEQTRLALCDGLTGLANARALSDALTAEIARSRRTGRPFALAYCDLDNFKRVNDSRGHAAGDALLQSVAQLLQSRLRKTDLAARIGGDEFAILLRETDAQGADHVVRELHTAAQERLRDVAAEVGVSIGLACFAQPPESSDQAIRVSDALMYEVKSQSKRAVRSLMWPPPSAEGDHARPSAAS